MNGSTLNPSTSLGFVPKGYPNYGQIHQENMLHLLESFAASTAPVNPTSGQLWYDTANNLLKVFDGSVFRSVSGSVPSASTAPVGPVIGQLWYDTNANILSYFDGAAWQTVAKLSQVINAATFIGNTVTLTRSGGTSPVIIDNIASVADINSLQAQITAADAAIAFAIALG